MSFSSENELSDLLDQQNEFENYLRSHPHEGQEDLLRSFEVKWEDLFSDDSDSDQKKVEYPNTEQEQRTEIEIPDEEIDKWFFKLENFCRTQKNIPKKVPIRQKGNIEIKEFQDRLKKYLSFIQHPDGTFKSSRTKIVSPISLKVFLERNTDFKSPTLSSNGGEVCPFCFKIFLKSPKDKNVSGMETYEDPFSSCKKHLSSKHYPLVCLACREPHKLISISKNSLELNKKTNISEESQSELSPNGLKVWVGSDFSLSKKNQVSCTFATAQTFVEHFCLVHLHLKFFYCENCGEEFASSSTHKKCSEKRVREKIEVEDDNEEHETQTKKIKN